MSNVVRAILAILFFPIFVSCNTTSESNGNLVGGVCTYTDTPGQATILSLNDAAPGANNCKNNPVEVVFDFTPTDPLKANNATDKNRHLTVGDGKNPPRDYIIGKGLTIGSTHQCIRKNINNGTCSPVIFEFPGIDLSDFAASCN